MIEKLRKHPYLLIGSIVCIITGIFLLISDPVRIINMIYFLLGGGLILTGIYKLILSENKEKMYMYDGIVDVIVGISFMFFHDLIITIILGLIFIAFPVVRIIKSIDKFKTFKKELPLLIIGLVIALSGGLMGNIFVKILGALFVLLGIYLFINIFTDKINILKSKNTSKNTRRKDVIDVDYEERG